MLSDALRRASIPRRHPRRSTKTLHDPSRIPLRDTAICVPSVKSSITVELAPGLTTVTMATTPCSSFGLSSSHDEAKHGLTSEESGDRCVAAPAWRVTGAGTGESPSSKCSSTSSSNISSEMGSRKVNPAPRWARRTSHRQSPAPEQTGFFRGPVRSFHW